MILGGGGSPAPLAELAVQLILCAVFCLWLIWSPLELSRGLIMALSLCGLMLLVPLLQLVPLPPPVWQALPGREPERAALALVGESDSWRALSMAPARTLSSLLALVPPAIVLLITGTLGASGRSMVVRTIAVVSFIAIIVGAMQTAGGESSPLRFYPRDAGYLNGFQANHNSSADVLLIGMVAYAVAVQDWLEHTGRRRTGQFPAMVVLSGVAILSAGVALTASRTGTALLPVAWLAVYAATRRMWRAPSRKLIFAGILLVAMLVAAGLLMRGNNAVVSSLLARYTFQGEMRPQIWADSLHAAQTYFPVGAGMGTFQPVFMAVERLELVHPALTNRAHNDYLELAIEAGVPGFLVLAAFVAILVRLAARQLRDASPRLRGQAIFAAATLTIVALHSQVDYPLRSIALACLAAASAGLLVPQGRGPQGANVSHEN